MRRESSMTVTSRQLVKNLSTLSTSAPAVTRPRGPKCFPPGHLSVTAWLQQLAVKSMRDSQSDGQSRFR